MARLKENKLQRPLLNPSGVTTTPHIKEYFFPNFSVKLTVPPYILKAKNEIKIDVTTNCTYGKAVIGNLVLSISIAAVDGQLILFSRQRPILNSNGVTTIPQIKECVLKESVFPRFDRTTRYTYGKAVIGSVAVSMSNAAVKTASSFSSQDNTQCLT